MAAHPAPRLAVSESEAEALRALIRAGTTEQRMVMRARIILRAAEGATNVSVAEELGVSMPTVLLWRRRFKEHGLAGPRDSRRCWGAHTTASKGHGGLLCRPGRGSRHGGQPERGRTTARWSRPHGRDLIWLRLTERVPT